MAAIAGEAAAANEAGIAKGQGGGTTDAVLAFDLPAQPLAQALERYSVVSGLQVVYDGSLAIGRTSASVEGIFLPAMALRMLLAGTGLSPRYMAADGFVLTAVPAGLDPLANTAPPTVAARYYGRIQSRLEQAFCTDGRTGSGGYRIALAVWIGPAGTITRSALLGSTGVPALDATIDRLVRDLAIGAPPPAGFAQPVTPALTEDCRTLPDGTPQIGAER